MKIKEAIKDKILSNEVAKRLAERSVNLLVASLDKTKPEVYRNRAYDLYGLAYDRLSEFGERATMSKRIRFAKKLNKFQDGGMPVSSDPNEHEIEFKADTLMYVRFDNEKRAKK